MTAELSEINQVRDQRDTAHAKNMRLRDDNARLRELFEAAKKSANGGIMYYAN